MQDNLLHYGTKRRSGRYPWGSGKDPYQHESWYFLTKVDSYRQQGLDDKSIAQKFGLTTTKFRDKITWANKEIKKIQTRLVAQFHDQGISNVDIAKSLGMSEGSVRNLIKRIETPRQNKLDATVEALKKGVDNTGYLDVGLGVERQIGVSQEKLRAARQKLLEEGYYEHKIYLKQITDPSKRTTIRVLTKEPDLEVVKQNSHLIRDLEMYSNDNGATFNKIGPPLNISWDRVKIKYAEQGGEDKDGLMELRRGVDDLDLGGAKYAQVRIAVNGTHYLKGMATYTDINMPEGVDIVFNTNKKLGTAKEDVLKPLKIGKDNVFGATITNQKGALNIVNEEGDWNDWSSTLSSQMLSKQPLRLVQERLDKTFSSLRKEYDELSSLNHPLVKERLMDDYQNSLTVAARKLKAQGIAGTKNHVLLPFPEMDPGEVYAPNYKDGDRVVLIRHPHGGLFEIPELRVNNKGPAKKVIANAIDAIGIHPSVAKKLSGADFDGDSVLVIPNNQKRIKSMRSLSDLKNFDNMDFKVPYETISKDRLQKEMGNVSNLITDMTIKGATMSEISRAVKHSMVVIDANKHKLDWKRSEEVHGIDALKRKYQTHVDPITGKQSRGASTIVSKASSEITVGQKAYYVTNPDTGRLNKKLTRGEKKYRMDIVDDAHLLSSGRPVENAYADYANKVKALQNSALKELSTISTPKRNPASAKLYREQVQSLDAKLDRALLNAPRERQAQLAATKAYYKNLDYDMTRDEKKRLRSQSLAQARATHKPDPKDVRITITPKEWEAIKADSLSANKVRQILRFADMDQVRQYATPKATTKLSSSRVERVRLLSSKGYTISEIANSMGVSTTAIKEAIREDNLKKG